MNTAFNISNTRPTGQSETSLMRMTISNLQTHKIETYPETTEYWVISPGGLAHFQASSEAAGFNLYSIPEQRLTKR